MSVMECDLANGLLWTAREYPIALSSIKSAPSWSWASTVSPAHMCHRQINNTLAVVIYAYSFDKCL